VSAHETTIHECGRENTHARPYDAPDRAFVGTVDSGLQQSTDGGDTWEAVGEFEDRVTAVTVSPHDPDTVAVSAASGAWKLATTVRFADPGDTAANSAARKPPRYTLLFCVVTTSVEIMKHILLPVDTSEDRASAQAETVVELFDPDNTIAHLFHVFSDNPEGASISQVASVRHAAEVLEETGVEVEYREASGDPAEHIIRLGEELDADAICIAGRKRSPAGKVLFGSVSQEVILGTDHPVLVCSPGDAT